MLGDRTPLATKTAIRYVCRLDDGDPLLEPSRQTWKRLGVPPNLMRAIDPLGQSKWWSFYHGIITPERFTVQLRSRGGYVEPTAKELAAVLKAVSMEREHYESVPHPEYPAVICYALKGLHGWWPAYGPATEYPAVICYALKDPNKTDYWLLEAVFPADRFQVAA